MKKKLFLQFVAFLLQLPVIAQLNTSFGIGYNTHNYPAYEFKFGYDIKRIDINGGFSRSLNRDANTHIYPGVEVGYNFMNEINSYWNDYQFTVSAGIFNDVINSDQKNYLNTWQPTLSLRYRKALKETSGIYSEVFYINKAVQITFGMYLKIE